MDEAVLERLAIDMGLELDDCKTLLCVCGWYIYGTRKRDAWQWARDAIGEVADYAAKSGVTLMLEPTATDSNLVEGCDDAIMMMEDIGRENVKLMFDVTHALYRNEVPSDYIYQMGKNLKHIHMADYDRKAPGPQPAVTLSTSCRRSRTSVMTATSQWKMASRRAPATRMSWRANRLRI